MKTCDKCGAQIADNASFCGECGHELPKMGPIEKPLLKEKPKSEQNSGRQKNCSKVWRWFWPMLSLGLLVGASCLFLDNMHKSDLIDTLYMRNYVLKTEIDSLESEAADIEALRNELLKRRLEQKELEAQLQEQARQIKELKEELDYY
ncbi:MAG: zinc-ribbon domain-containing protein [Muribaculaceae bacterium]|nr:zinc-ribbon domain-containing protein [Muribaculaceae bacterium]